MVVSGIKKSNSKYADYLIDSKYAFLIIFFIACILIFFSYFLFNAGSLHFHPNFLSDQINYVNTTRNLVNYGHFIIPGQFQGTGTGILPGLIFQDNTRLYMPGYYIFSAIFYKIFGQKGCAFILPNIIAYLISIVLIYIFVIKNYSRDAALLSMVLFVFFPLNIFFSLTAMSEMSIMLFFFITFNLAVRLRNKFELFFLPVLITLACLFRQTGLFLLIPIVGFLLDRGRLKQFWKIPLIVISSLILFFFS